MTHESHSIICDDPVMKIPFEIEGILFRFLKVVKQLLIIETVAMAVA
jgi:hypothetical protein